MTYDPTKPYKRQLLQLIQSTWDSPHLKVRPGLYPVFERTTTGLEIDHTDGIGTKGEYHWRQRTFGAAVQDALAMNLNDLAMARAKAYKLQNHLTLPADDHAAILEIIGALANECKQRQIVMTGGETSIHDGATGMDISLTVSGIVIDDQPNQMKAGDVLIGLLSSGLHSNGFSKVREVLGDVDRPEFTIPTVLYDQTILSLIREFPVHGMMHITGGAFTKLLDIAQGVDVTIKRKNFPTSNPIWPELVSHGLSDEEMYRTFNCGIGFAVSVSPSVALEVQKKCGGVEIGNIVPGVGRITIESVFSKQTVTFNRT